jgi:hypothetical protein
MKETSEIAQGKLIEIFYAHGGPCQSEEGKCMQTRVKNDFLPSFLPFFSTLPFYLFLLLVVLT